MNYPTLMCCGNVCLFVVITNTSLLIRHGWSTFWRTGPDWVTFLSDQTPDFGESVLHPSQHDSRNQVQISVLDIQHCSDGRWSVDKTQLDPNLSWKGSSCPRTVPPIKTRLYRIVQPLKSIITLLFYIFALLLEIKVLADLIDWVSVTNDWLHIFPRIFGIIFQVLFGSRRKAWVVQ